MDNATNQGSAPIEETGGPLWPFLSRLPVVQALGPNDHLPHGDPTVSAVLCAYAAGLRASSDVQPPPHLTTLIPVLLGQPGSESAEFSVYGEAAHAVLVARGATRRATSYVYPDGRAHVIETAQLRVAGVEVRAWYTRPPTDTERAAAAEGPLLPTAEFRSAAVEQAGGR